MPELVFLDDPDDLAIGLQGDVKACCASLVDVRDHATIAEGGVQRSAEGVDAHQRDLIAVGDALVAIAHDEQFAIGGERMSVRIVRAGRHLELNDAVVAEQGGEVDGLCMREQAAASDREGGDCSHGPGSFRMRQTSAAARYPATYP